MRSARGEAMDASANAVMSEKKGVILMTDYTIKLSTGDVKDFVQLTDRTPCDVDLLDNRYVVNAKSIMGVFSLDLSGSLTLRIYGMDKNYIEAVRKYFVEVNAA